MEHFQLHQVPPDWASQVVKNPPANAGDTRDMGSNTGSGRSPGGGHGNPLQYSCLENPMDRGTWWPTVHGVAKKSNTTQLLNNNKMHVCVCVYVCVCVCKIYIYIFFFIFRFFSLLGYYRVYFPVLYSGSLLVVYFIYSSVYILILNS